MSFKIIFILFAFWRFFDLFILFFAPLFIPYLGFFPYVQELKKFHLPSWIFSLANFDGVHYLKIASGGYEQYQQAFFPLYPLLIKLITPIFFNNSFFAGFFISNLSFLFGLYFFSKYLEMLKIKKCFIFYTLYFILLFPASFFFGAVYTEGLFFFLLIASLYFLKKESYLTAGVFAFLAALTKLIGIFLIVPFAIRFFQYQKLNLCAKGKSASSGKNQKDISKVKYLLLIFSPLFGFFFYCLYLWKTTRDPFFFLNSQPVFGANRSTDIIFLPQVYFRYLKIFLTASFNFQYFISLFEFVVFNFVFFVLIRDLLKIFSNIKYQASSVDFLGLSLFSFFALLLPTLTGTLSSIPRYSLFSLSFFIFLAQIKNKWIKIIIAMIFFIFHIVTLAFFGQGYFVS